jgi:hypothetical protein
MVAASTKAVCANEAATVWCRPKGDTTIGYKFDKVNGSNGSISFTRVPIDVVVSYANWGGRLGLGATYHAFASYSCDASGLCNNSVKFPNAFGGIAQLAYALKLKTFLLDVGLRYTLIKYKGDNSVSLNGSGPGFFFGVGF